MSGKVYDADGKLLYDNTWRSYYVGEPTIVRVGTKKPPKPEAGRRMLTTHRRWDSGITTATGDDARWDEPRRRRLPVDPVTPP